MRATFSLCATTNCFVCDAQRAEHTHTCWLGNRKLPAARQLDPKKIDGLYSDGGGGGMKTRKVGVVGIWYMCVGVKRGTLQWPFYMLPIAIHGDVIHLWLGAARKHI